MKNTKINSAFILSLSLLFSCGDQIIENSGDNLSSDIQISSSTVYGGGGTKNSQETLSSSSTSSDSSLNISFEMKNFTFSGGPLKSIEGDLYHFGNGVQKADLKNQTWKTLGSNDKEFTQNLFYYDKQILRLILNNSQVQTYATSWKTYDPLNNFAPTQIDVFNSDTLFWLDNTSFSKIHTQSLGFEAKWSGLETTLASDLKINESEISLCKGSFYSLNRVSNQFTTSSNPCDKIQRVQNGWLALDEKNSGSVDACFYLGGVLKESFTLDHDEIPLVFDTKEDSYLYFKKAKELYSFNGVKLSKSSEIEIPQNIDQIIFDQEILWALDSLGKLIQVSY